MMNEFVFLTKQLCYHAGLRADPDERDKVNMSTVQRRTEDYVKRFFPCLEPKPSVVESCMYTVRSVLTCSSVRII